MGTRTVWRTETVEYKFTVEAETDDEALEKAQAEYDGCTDAELGDRIHDIGAVDWYVETL